MKKRFLSMCVAICVLVTGLFSVNAEQLQSSVKSQDLSKSASDVTYEDVLAGIVSPYDYFGELDEDTVPDAVGIETAKERVHIRRLYDEEPDLNTVIFENPDGSRTMYVFDYPVKYIADDGSVKDISLEITPHAEVTGAYETKSAAITTTFAQEITEGIAMKDDKLSIQLIPQLPIQSSSRSLAAVAETNVKQIDEKTVAYTYDSDTTIEYSLTYTGFKEDIVVSTYTGQTEYDFTLLTGGLTLTSMNGGYYLCDADGKVRAVLGDVIIFTADEKNNGMGYMTHRTVKENQEYVITIHVDEEYLRDEKTAYPIRIDPTIEINYGSGTIQDVTINSAAGSDGTSASLYIGNREEYGISRVLMRFPISNFSSASIPAAYQITSATVEIRDLRCESEEMTVECYVFNGNTWSESSANWSNVSPDSFTTFLSSNNVSYANGIQLTETHRYSFDITEAVRGWIIGNYDINKGIMFKPSSAVENGSTYIAKTFASFSRTSNQPSLTITYSSGTPVIPDDDYYINSKCSGKYLNFIPYFSDVGGISGLIDEHGTDIQWRVRNVSGGAVLQPLTDTTKYLAVSEDKTYVELITVSGTAIPTRCIWTASFTTDGGFRLKNIYNNEYLFTYDTIVGTASNLGSVGTELYQSRIWRGISVTNMQGRELAEIQLFHGAIAMMTKNAKIRYRQTQSNAIWTEVSDYNYTVQNSNIATINAQEGVIIPKAQGKTKAQVQHKTTGYITEFDIEVIPLQQYKGTLAVWENVEVNTISYWDHTPTVYVENYSESSSFYFEEGVQCAISQWNSALGITMTITQNEDEADIRIYGGTQDAMIQQGQLPNETTATGLTYTSKEGYDGYYMIDNEAKISRKIRGARILIFFDGQSINECKKTVTHELGHALGYDGHAGGTTSVMYYKRHVYYTLKAGEIAHLQQMYA